ncbi:peptide/nickel transport system permease protein [Thermomonospora echinospora]|uniref:Peptide/nickel transport system permease protein n=1 Tax=Thermomonospora echinospora TaxID=1992 RepID=A0A1H6DVL1_9ACTN|nr:ABC transporter permease [Thermomonospora echinospora]SEG88625.1 peptide/nickel transport system permease protein [Thermomonospora echinospora]
MLRMVVLRLLAMIPLVFLVATGVFFLGQLSDVDPAENIVGPNATEEQVAAVRAELGLDRPALEQYADWLSGAVRGDLGESLYTKADVTTSLTQALPITLSLTFGGLLVGLALGVPSGIWSALRAGRAGDRAVSLLATVGQAVPGFWLGLLLIIAFAIRLPWFPAVGYVPPGESLTGWLHCLVLPSVSLGLIAAAAISRQTRSSMIGVLQQEYVRTALSKGLSKRRVVVKHALKNAAVPVVTVVSFQVTTLLGGSIVIERLFAMPGLGALAINAVVRRDPDVIQGIVVLTVIVIVLVNVLLDLSYAWLNPKVRSL